MARQSERRSHLDLQVGMLSEQELTTILQMLQKLCQHMGVNVDSSKQEVQSFTKTTNVHKLASELEDNFRRNNDARYVSIYGERKGRTILGGVVSYSEVGLKRRSRRLRCERRSPTPRFFKAK
jgi:osmotically-inducible protein OsmY